MEIKNVLSIVLLASASLMTAQSPTVFAQTTGLDQGKELVNSLFSRGRNNPPPKSEDEAQEEAITDDRRTIVTTATVLGGITGAIADEGDRKRGAGNGAVAGVIVGTVMANAAEESRRNYGAQHNLVNGNIAAVNQVISSMSNETAVLESRATKRDRELAATRQSTHTARALSQSEQTTLDDIQRDIKTNRVTIANAQIQLKVINDDIGKFDLSPDPTPEQNAQVATLKSQRDQLLTMLNRLNGIDGQLVAQSNLLTGGKG